MSALQYLLKEVTAIAAKVSAWRQYAPSGEGDAGLYDLVSL